MSAKITLDSFISNHLLKTNLKVFYVIKDCRLPFADSPKEH